MFRWSAEGREFQSGFVSTDGNSFRLFQVDGNFTTAFDVNNAGVVVGDYRLPGFTEGFGFILNQGELTSGISASPDAVRTDIWGINDDGLFVGSFRDADGDAHAFYSVVPGFDPDDDDEEDDDDRRWRWRGDDDD